MATKSSDILIARDEDKDAMIVPRLIILGKHYIEADRYPLVYMREEAFPFITYIPLGFEDYGTQGSEVSIHDIQIDDKKAVYVAAGGSAISKHVFKLEKDTQKKLWAVEVDGSSDNASYFQFTGSIYDGATKLAFSPDEKYVYATSGPDDDDYTLHKIDTQTGAVAWRTGTGLNGSLAADLFVDHDSGDICVVYIQHETEAADVDVIHRYRASDGVRLYSTGEGLTAYCCEKRVGGSKFYVGLKKYTDTNDYNFHRYDWDDFTVDDLAPEYRTGLTYYENMMFFDWIVAGAIEVMSISPNDELAVPCYGNDDSTLKYMYVYYPHEDPEDGENFKHLIPHDYWDRIMCIRWFYGQLWYNWHKSYDHVGINVINSVTGALIKAFLQNTKDAASYFCSVATFNLYGVRSIIRADTSESSVYNHVENDCGCFLEPQSPWISYQDYLSWDEGQWLDDVDYGVDAEVTNDDEAYWCIQINGPATDIIEPGTTAGWDEYWVFRERPRIDDVHGCCPYRYRDSYGNGTWKCLIDDYSSGVANSPHPIDFWKKLSCAVSRPFVKWHKWVSQKEDKIYSWVVHEGKYYKCKDDHAVTGYNYDTPLIGYYEPEVTVGWAAYWEEVTIPLKKWDSYKFGGVGEFEDVNTTPHYYTVIISGYAPAYDIRNGIYHLEKQGDRFDGVWMCQRRRIGIEESDVELRIGEPTSSEDEIKTVLDVDFVSPFAAYLITANYVVDNQRMCGGLPYVCKLANGPGGAGVYIPGVTADWETYWEYETNFSTLSGGLDKNYSSGIGFLETDKTNPDGTDTTDFHGCVYEAHHINISGDLYASWYPGAIKEWDSNKTYSNDKVVIYSNRFYRSTKDNNTSTPGVAGWTLLTN